VESVITQLQAEHRRGRVNVGIDGITGEIIDVFATGILELGVVKQQIIKTATEFVCCLLRIDDVILFEPLQKYIKPPTPF